MRRAGPVVWKEIAETIGQEIAAGKFPAGGRLPIETELASRFGVNRHTVRRALAALAERGTISIQPGRGTFVEAKLSYPITRRTRFSEAIGVSGSRGTLVRSWTMTATERMASDLGIEIGSPLVAFDNLRFIDQVPVSLTTHHFPLPRFEGIAERFAETGSITQALANSGVADYERLLTRVHCRAATSEELRLLDAAQGNPVLVLESVNAETGRQPIEYGLSRSIGERFELIIQADQV